MTAGAGEAALLGQHHALRRVDRELLVRREPVLDGDGIYRGYRGIDRDITSRKKAGEERERLFNELSDALANIKTLRGMLPICSYCKKIRDDKGYWDQVDSYISKHTDTVFSHGMCPECAQKVLKDYEEFKKKQGH